MEDYTSKYFGILKHINEDYINANIFKQVLESGVFAEFQVSSGYLGVNYFGLETETDDFRCDFNDFFLFNNKEYNLKYEVWKDMFSLHSYHIELYHSMSDFNINHYLVEFHSFLTIEEKKEYLNNLYKNFLSFITEKDLLFLYLKNAPARGYENWEEYYILEQLNNEDFRNLFKFLKGDIKFYAEDVNVRWREFRVFKEIYEFVNNKLNSLNDNCNLVIENVVSPYADWRSDIFENEKCRLLYDYIVSSYNGEKNTSFFSMLYKYFQEKKHIKILDNDSLVYRDFVKSQYDIKSFKRVQKKTSEKEKNKWDVVFEVFDEFIKTYSKI